MKHLLLFIGILFSGMALQAQIVVNENPDPLVVCDVNNNGFAFFDLHDADVDITLGDPSLIVTYHITMLDAETAINMLISPYMNQVPYSDTVYARAENPQGYFAVVLLDLLVQELPPITPPINLRMDDDNGDGFAIFDLTENETIMLQGLNPSDYNVFYYEAEDDAVNGEFHITDPTSYHNIENPQTIYVRVGNINKGCFVIASFIISVGTLSVDTFGFKDLNFFPNPTSESFTIQSSKFVSETTVLLYNIQGRMVSSEKMLPNNKAITVDVSSLENGVYFVKISSEGNSVVKKMIKE